MHKILGGNVMSDQLIGVIVGGAIGMIGAIVGALVNHWLTLRRDIRSRKLEEADRLRSQLTGGAKELALRQSGVDFGNSKTFSGNIDNVAGSSIKDHTVEQLIVSSRDAEQLVINLEKLSSQIPEFSESMVKNAELLGHYLRDLTDSYKRGDSRNTNLYRIKAMKNRNANTPVSELVQEVLDNISSPYPEDITDQVCLAIERNVGWNKRYNSLVENHSPKAVNSQIGRSTLQLTGMKNLGERSKATSSLIKTYTRLG